MYNVSRLKKIFTSDRQLLAKQWVSKFLQYSTASTSVKKECDVEYKVGDELHGYTVKQISQIEEFSATGILLEHVKTGAEHLHINRDDGNNVFSVAFRTTPLDNTGVSHILEHTVLCGSAKYPCRDPFFKMLNRSLSTFMNAFTASDWTMYPFSTQNHKDFENLMSVYLDAVFFPNLSRLDFLQEGWRLEQKDLKDENSEIIFKGVVFNEMKGALANGESLFVRKHQCLLLPDHTYGYNSGGDPLEIPNLTHENLKSFHEVHYHPSNSRFYTYGSFPLDGHLKLINESVLEKFERIQTNTSIPSQKKWSEAKQFEMTCPPDPLAPDMNKQTTVAVSFLLEHTNDPFEMFTFGFISTLLTDGPNSPFYQALIEPNIGSSYVPTAGGDSHTKNPSFSVGLQGVHENDVNKVINIIHETFEKVSSDGFEQERIDSLLHTIELSQRHQTSNFGLTMIMNVISAWNHDKNPLEQFTLNKQVNKLKEALAEDNLYLQKKMKEYFLDNRHKLILTMHPKKEYVAEQDAFEEKLLHEKTKCLNAENKREIYNTALELESKQNNEEDVSCLPKMFVKDIEKSIKKTPTDIVHIDQTKVFTMEQPTNEVTYFRAIVTTSSIPFIVRPYLPLFCQVLTKLGTANMDYKSLSQQIQMHTGGLSVSPHLVGHHTEADSFEQGILLSSHCLERNIPIMYYLWQEVINSPDLINHSRLKTLIKLFANDLSTSVAHSGHLYAMSVAGKNLTASAQVSELFGGLAQVNFIKSLAERDTVDDVIENLLKLATYLLNANEMRCSLNTTKELMNTSLQGLESLLSSLSVVGYDDVTTIEDSDFKARASKTFVEMDFPVNYVSKCVRVVPFTHPDHASLQLLAKLISAKYLHREIREKGGAYGGGAKLGGSIFAFYSYRDPNTRETLDAFNGSIEWASKGGFAHEDLEEAKLSVFSGIDSPIAPANRGMAFFKNHVTDEMRQTHRERLFAVDKQGLVDVAQRYLLSEERIEAEAIIGPRNETILTDSSWKPFNVT